MPTTTDKRWRQRGVRGVGPRGFRAQYIRNGFLDTQEGAQRD
jgi:hypothetical protein